MRWRRLSPWRRSSGRPTASPRNPAAGSPPPAATAPSTLPPPAEMPDRLHAVLTTVNLVYTEGHTATTGESLTRVDLSREAIRLARVLTELMPDEPEAVGHELGEHACE